MTQTDFFAYVNLNPSSLNVWYDESGPPYTVRGLSIPVVDNTGEDSNRYLSQVQQVSIPLFGGSTSNITLTVRESIYVLSLGISCYILLVDPLKVDSIGNTITGDATVLLSPTTDVATFADSAYNTLGGSIQDLRQSTYIMQSDRYKIGTLANPTYTGPLNIEDLLTNSAAKANIQDSNYSSVGWTRSRYDGTKTSRNDNKIDPAIAGRLFTGAEFASGSDVNQINYLMSSSQVDYKDLFYAGKGDIPGFDLSATTGLKFVESYTATDKVIRVSSINLKNPRYTPYEGDLIVNNRTPGSPELIKILQVGREGSTLPVTYTLKVTRGYFSSANIIDSSDAVYRATPVQIYNIDNNKLSGVPKGIILVKETGKRLGIDSLGYVISTS